eukprot:816033-Lingulodinium_polyedra.AAC.1
MENQMHTLFDAIHRHVVVIVGPQASDLWRHQPAEGSLHAGSVCCFCPVSAVQGPCEHQHVAHLHLRTVSKQVASKPAR